MGYLGIDDADLKKGGGIFTAKEISGQPALRSKVWDKVIREKLQIASFSQEVLPKIDTVMLTGAGTSAFIGRSISGRDTAENRCNHAFLGHHPSGFTSQGLFQARFLYTAGAM